eukprot:762563-Hanusia_phi.AAC.3
MNAGTDDDDDDDDDEIPPGTACDRASNAACQSPGPAESQCSRRAVSEVGELESFESSHSLKPRPSMRVVAAASGAVEEEMARRFERKELVGTGILVGRMTAQRDTVLFFIPTPDMGGKLCASLLCPVTLPSRLPMSVLSACSPVSSSTSLCCDLLETDEKGTWSSVDESWIFEHAVEVQRMLPGGLMPEGRGGGSEGTTDMGFEGMVSRTNRTRWRTGLSDSSSICVLRRGRVPARQVISSSSYYYYYYYCSPPPPTPTPPTPPTPTPTPTPPTRSLLHLLFLS